MGNGATAKPDGLFGSQNPWSEGDTPERVPVLQRLGTHHLHTQTNVLLNVTVWLWKTKTFNDFLQCHPSACIKSVFWERVVLERLILETDVQEADLRVAKHSMTLTWNYARISNNFCNSPKHTSAILCHVCRLKWHSQH